MDFKDVFNFNEFLFESKAPAEGINVVILSSETSNDTVKNLSAEISKKGQDCIVIDVNTASVSQPQEDGSVLIYDKNNKNGIKIYRKNTLILPRRGVILNTYSRNVMSDLQELNFFCVNNLESIETCENKFITSKKLESQSITIPKTAIIQNMSHLKESVKMAGGKFPIVVKLVSGTQGIGVFIVDSFGSLKSVLQTLWKVDPTVEILLQEKIDADYDIRVQVVVKNDVESGTNRYEIIGAMRRNVVKGDFRTNVHLGGQVEPIKLTSEQEEMAKAATKAVGCNWCGVDIIVDKTNGKNYVLEVNASPGTAGIQKATNGELIPKLVDFLLNKKYWHFPPLEVGFREAIFISGIAKMVAKFDTGNGSLSCSMHADSWEEKDGFIEWELMGRKFRNEIVGHSEPKIGDKIFKRPIIELDINFAGRKLPKTRVSLVDRSDKSTPFLANRKMMERLGVSVNPDKNFVASEFKKDYKAAEIFGNSLNGIKMLG
jgi:ribosomal protein S6--L-glutamate ligase